MSRCKYRANACVGQTEIITQDTIRRDDVGKVVQVDNGCYFDAELKQWLEENPTLPHNRQPFTNANVEQCKRDNAGTATNSASQLSPAEREMDRRNIRKRLGIIRRNIDVLYERGKSYEYFDHTLIAHLSKMCAPEHQRVCYESIRQYINKRYNRTPPRSNYVPTTSGYNSPVHPYISDNANLDQVLQILQQNEAFSCTGNNCNHTMDQLNVIHYHNQLQIIKTNIDLLVSLRQQNDMFNNKSFVRKFIKKMASMCPPQHYQKCKHYIRNYIDKHLDSSSMSSNDSYD